MKKMLSLVFLAFISVHLKAQKAEVFTNSSKAIRGYDPVAYFVDGKPVQGNEKFMYHWKNADWFFSSKQNLDSFIMSPEKYAPQYGGYCAYGCSQGYKAPTDPNAWSIENGKLYLNYNLKVRELWAKEKKERIEKGDKNWLLIKDKG
jgi:YHS domain-containing protein